MLKRITATIVASLVVPLVAGAYAPTMQVASVEVSDTPEPTPTPEAPGLTASIDPREYREFEKLSEGEADGLASTRCAEEVEPFEVVLMQRRWGRMTRRHWSWVR